MNILTSSCFSLLTSTIHHLLGSWNASFSPKANLAVGRPEPKPSNGEDGDDNSTEKPINDLTYHHAFALFQIYSAIINIPICIYWAGGIQRVNAVLGEAARTPSTIILVVIFRCYSSVLSNNIIYFIKNPTSST